MHPNTKLWLLGAAALLTTLTAVYTVVESRKTPDLSSGVSTPVRAAEPPSLRWRPPADNADGTALTDLAGYKVYWGTEPGEYSDSATIDDPAVTSFPLPQLAPGTYYFVMTTINRQEIESDHSAVAEVRVKPDGDVDIVVLDVEDSSLGPRRSNDTPDD